MRRSRFEAFAWTLAVLGAALFVPMPVWSALTTGPEVSCGQAVQGKVAWNRAGATGWDPANVERLCAGTTDANAVVACFTREIAAHDDWRRAIDACQGAQTSSQAAPPSSAVPPSANCNCFGSDLSAAERQYLTDQLAVYRSGASTAASSTRWSDFLERRPGGSARGLNYQVEVAGIYSNTPDVTSARCWRATGEEARVDLSGTDLNDWAVCAGSGGNFSMTLLQGPTNHRILEWAQHALADPGSSTLKRDIRLYEPPRTSTPPGQTCLRYLLGESVTTLYGARPTSVTEGAADSGGGMKTHVFTFSVDRIETVGTRDSELARTKQGDIRPDCIAD